MMPCDLRQPRAVLYIKRMRPLCIRLFPIRKLVEAGVRERDSDAHVGTR